MPAATLIQKAPLIRLLLPFVAGLLLEDTGLFPEYAWPVILAAAFALFVTSGTLRRVNTQYKYRHFFGIAVSLLFLAFGVVSSHLSRSGKTEIEWARYSYIKATVTDHGRQKSNSRLYEAIVSAGIDGGQTTRFTCPALLYFSKEEQAGQLAPGDEIILPNTLQQIANSRNPEAFDYRGYRYRQGYRYSGFVAAGSWLKTGTNAPTGWKAQAIEIRESALKHLHNARFRPENEAILAALLLGKTDGVTQQQKDEFSAAGLSHILAVSGLHVSIILSIGLLLLYPFYYFRLRSIENLALLLALWGYAFVTGLPPSIVRACTMITILLIGRCIGRKRVTLNSLLAAALLMLLYRPDYLFDVGFQLSFASVASIVCILPRLEPIVAVSQPALRYIVSMLFVTLAVQVGTWLITAFYFHNIPLFALFTNLIVLPFLPVIIGGSLLLIGVDSLAASTVWLKTAIDYLLVALREITDYCQTTAFATVRDLSIEPEYFLLYFSALYLLFRLFQKREARHLIALQACALLFILAAAYLRPLYRTDVRSAVLVYDRVEAAFIQVVDRGKNLIIPVDSAFTPEAGRYATQLFNRKNHLPEPLFTTSSGTCAGVTWLPPFIQRGNTRLLILNSGFWTRKYSDSPPLAVDYAVIGQSFSGSIKPLARLFKIDSVILTSGVAPLDRYRYKNECKMLNIGVYSVRDNGAWIKTGY